MTAQKAAASTAHSQRISKRQAPHEVTSADLMGGIYAENDMHFQSSVEPFESGVTDGTFQQSHYVAPVFTLLDEPKHGIQGVKKGVDDILGVLRANVYAGTCKVPFGKHLLRDQRLVLKSIRTIK